VKKYKLNGIKKMKEKRDKKIKADHSLNIIAMFMA